MKIRPAGELEQRMPKRSRLRDSQLCNILRYSAIPLAPSAQQLFPEILTSTEPEQTGSLFDQGCETP